MKLAPATTPEKAAGLDRLIMPSSKEGAADCKVKTPWYIHLRHDSHPDAELAIELRGDVALGVRINPGDDADLDLSIWQGHEQGISRRHLMLRPTDNNLFAIDLDSTNGSRLNGLPMTPSCAYPLTSGDLLTLAHLHVRVVKVARATESVPA
jgi:hypothetical protein